MRLQGHERGYGQVLLCVADLEAGIILVAESLWDGVALILTSGLVEKFTLFDLADIGQVIRELSGIFAILFLNEFEYSFSLARAGDGGDIGVLAEVNGQ